MVVKREVFLTCSNVEKQVARCLLPVFGTLTDLGAAPIDA